MKDAWTSTAVKFVMAGPHVALVTIDREAARNAINSEVAQALELAVHRVEQDKDLRVAILTGAGNRSFCSGADLREVAEGRMATFFTSAGGFAGFTRLTRTKPWIAAVNGVAFAGGLEIVLACDMIVACETAAFGLPEVKVGLVAGAGGVFRLPQKLPANIAAELILTGDVLTAERAQALGLVNRLCSSDRLIDEAIALAGKIASNSPSSVHQSMRILASTRHHAEGAGWSASDIAMVDITHSSDFVEGPAAFLERRPAIWRVG